MGTCLDCEKNFDEETIESELQHRVAWLYTVDAVPQHSVVEIDHVMIATFDGTNAIERGRDFAEQLRQLYVSHGACVPEKVKSSDVT